jgi:uncharacterized protein YqcC (DUF446 family)
VASVHERLASKADEIEAELRLLGWWSAPKPDMNFTKAFGMDTMAFGQWLTFVLVPRIREMVATKGTPPRGSMVAVQAVREFDGQPETDELQRLLRELDEIVNA